MQADRLAYDNKNAIVIASGHVEVVRGERILLADTIYYYQNQDVVKAKGNISLLQPDGNVLFADNLVLEEQFKRGIVRHFKARFADNSAFAAAEARRLDEQHIQLKKAVYSPCKICAEDADAEPLWQIKADDVMVDNEKQQIEYENATLEVKGVPVFYTPYFVHPTPDADRKSGLLRPQHGRTSNLGFSAQYPYYWNIAPDKDATITPWYTSEEGWVGLAEYRQLLDDGFINFSGSATFPDKRNETTGERIDGRELRGHFFTQGQGSITEDWRWGFDINRTSDDTYLRRYRFGFFETLPSRIYAENVDKRDYLLAETLTFQRLDGSIPSAEEPFILPNLFAHVESNPLWQGSRASLDASSFTLTRRDGADMRRLSAQTLYSVPYITNSGHVFKADMGLRTDMYHQSNVVQQNGAEFEGTTARVVPHAALHWRYPLMTQLGNTRLTVEPLAKIVTSTRGHNDDEINNEDSLTPEFNSLNLFRSNRYAGLDRIEEGTRAMAGLQGQMALSEGEVISAMAGQEVRLDDNNNPFPVTNDPSRDASDIVGQVAYDGARLNLDSRYRLDTQDYALRRWEARGNYRFSWASFGVDHVRIDDDAILDDRNDLTAYSSVQPWEDINISVYGRRDFLRDAMVMAGTGIAFSYDCITLYTNFNREFTRDRDFKPDTSITFNIGLKNISN
jgi:LPS-assembly protein